MNPIRLVFLGTAGLACPSLRRLAEHPDYEISLVITQPDRPKGRSLRLSPPPVKDEALRHGLTVLQPPRLARDPAVIQALKDARPDVIVVAAYGQILPKNVLEIPPRGCLNVHASLLPKYRGAAPIQWALIHGERLTGVTIMKMDEGLDTGDIVTQKGVAILPEDDGQTLHDKLAAVGADLLVQTIPAHLRGELHPVPQDSSRASSARKIVKGDGWIDWRRPAGEIINRLRALSPWPGVFTSFVPRGTAKRLRIWRAQVGREISGQPGEIIGSTREALRVACGAEGLKITEVQLDGARRLPIGEFLRGHPLPAGSRFCRPAAPARMPG